jgi:hypothetical protein
MAVIGAHDSAKKGTSKPHSAYNDIGDRAKEIFNFLVSPYNDA